MYYPLTPNEAVLHHKISGPHFTLPLAIWNSPLNADKGGVCFTSKYGIDEDEYGNSVLTGDGGQDYFKQFTCTEIEVFLLE